MIAWLSGRLLSKKPTNVVIDVGGVGYSLSVSLNTFYNLPEEGEDIRLHVYTSVREDAIQLFGFSETGEKDIFEKLIGVNKIGPKLAVTILSGISHPELAEAIMTEDKARLASIPGIGKKTAERVIMELKDKLEDKTIVPGYKKTPVSGVIESVVEALVSLGYKRQEAQKAAEKACSHGVETDLESALKESLKLIS